MKLNKRNAASSGECLNKSIIVYDDYAGMPLMITAMGGQWWVTTPDEKMELLDEYKQETGLNFCFLCNEGGKVGAWALAKLLGKACENPEVKVDYVMMDRVQCLKRMGVVFNLDDETLQMEVKITPNEDKSMHMKRYAIRCNVKGNFFDKFFDIDCFDNESDAYEWAGCYFDILDKLGINYKIAYNNGKEKD